MILSGGVLAAPPIAPTTPPLFSFDADSPKCQSGIVGPSAVLALDSPDPRTVIPCDPLGVCGPTADLDALSGSGSGLTVADSFALLISVDRDTVGGIQPDAALVALQVPYNVTDQVGRGQAAGDQYMSMALCTLSAGCQAAPRVPLINNVLIRNNYDEGGTDFSADPPTSADDDGGGAPEDNVDATSADSASLRAPDILNVYFSITSPLRGRSGASAAGELLGADILFNPDPLDVTGADTTLFAFHTDLGLQAFDDIDGMIVFDLDVDGVFNGTDVILFSLTPDSPSVGLIPGSDQDGGGANVFMVSPGVPPERFISAGELGLGNPSDNIDALDVLLCGNAVECAALRGIRRLMGDFDDDGDVDLDDRITFESCFTGPGVAYADGCERGDFDGDGDIDCDDWHGFESAWTSPDPIPALLDCPVPTVSEWGLAVLTLLLLATGTVVIRLRPARADVA